VLLNLILNGLQAMNGLPPEQRRLVVQARRLDEEVVELSVKDGGPGIQAERLADLFEPFHTTKSEGLGVGLAISRVIVESHGGSIRVENNPAGGATFRFTLKVAGDGGRDLKEGGTR
jgi:two-component system sensor kinase FixL